MRWFVLMLVSAGCLAAPSTADARGGWERRAAYRAVPYPHSPYPHSLYQQPVAQPAVGGPRAVPSWRGLYPQYYGGFHARHLQNIGIPTGDIGIRGNSITVNPW